MSKLTQLATKVAEKLNDLDQAIVDAADAQVDAMIEDVSDADTLTKREYNDLITAYGAKDSAMTSAINTEQSARETEVANILGVTGDATSATVFGLIKIANDQDASLRSTLDGNRATADKAIDTYAEEVGTYNQFAEALAGE